MAMNMKTLIFISGSRIRKQLPPGRSQYEMCKECVAVLIELYKKSSAVSGAGFDFVLGGVH